MATETPSIPGKIEENTAKDDFRKQFKDPAIPDDFEDAQSFLKWAVKLFDDDLEDDRENREQAITDTKFMAGEQWDDFVKQNRVAAKKPTLVFNRLPAFVAQIIGNRRLNKTDIKIIADDTAFRESAKVREGLVRSIQKVSKADVAYNKALENQVISGLGNFEVCLEYAYDDVFEQDIKIKAINNSFSVVWDHQSEEPTGEDAAHCFTVSTMRNDQFKREWPNASSADPTTDTQLLGYDIGDGWITQDEVRIVHMWRMRSHRRIFALLTAEEGEEDGEDVVDITDLDPEEFTERLVTNAQGLPIMREVDRKYAQLYIFTATDILEGPYELPINRVPVFRVPGWDINVGEQRTRFGLIRFLKDPQKLHNYWRSIIAEKLMLSPKGNWIASEAAIAGRETEWRESHLSNDPLLVYNDDGSAPVRTPPSQIEAGLIQEAGMAAQDLRDISNLHEASLGQQSNEVSGKAILARQRVGETGTVIYQDNLDLAIEACGGVINQLIPFAYDTARTIKIMGEEGEELSPVVINDQTNEDSVDITAGKYSVTSSTGPSFVTKRVEAGESMLNMVNAMPDTMAIAADKIVEAQDWPGATEIARRIRLNLPPGMLNPNDLSPEQQQQQAQAAEQASVQAQKEDQLFQLELAEKQASVTEMQARATQAEALAAKALASIDIDQFKAVADVESDRVKNIMEGAKFFAEQTDDSEVDTPVT